jgi:hypothetical protein
VNYSRTERDQSPKRITAVLRDDDRQRVESDSPNNRRKGFAEERRRQRREQEIERGYRINIKQVVLAFAVEFFIIALILVGQYYIAEQAARERVISILLFPIGLAVVELARVPLAIAVRTQNSWSVKLMAAMGVIVAVTVTSFSLSTIAYQTFDPRLIEANEKNDALQNLKSQRTIVQNEIAIADTELATQRKELDGANDRIKNLQDQISKVNAIPGQNCKTITNPADNTTSKTCTASNLNAAQAKTLQDQLKNAVNDRDALATRVKAAEAVRAKYDLRPVDERVTKAESDYRMAVTRSQLHSYTSFVVRKSPTEVTDSEVKGLEFYLIFIPSIAAALASTLLAITAVHRIRPKAESAVTMPDEALSVLLGPLVQTIEQEARNMIARAMSAHSQAAGAGTARG